MKNKQLYLFMSAAVLALASVGCGSNTGKNEDKTSSNTYSNIGHTREDLDKNIILETQATTEAPDEQEYELNVPNISEQLIWDSFGIKVKFKGIELNDFGDLDIKIEVENNSIADVYVKTDGLAINDMMVHGNIATEKLAIGEKAEAFISVQKNWLMYNSIYDIGKITMVLESQNAETFKIMDVSDEIEIKTDRYDSVVYAKTFEGKELYNKNGYLIKAIGFGKASTTSSHMLVYM